jgi:hypothetical protein
MRQAWTPLALLSLVLPFTPAVAGDPDGHVNVFLGQKFLASADWDPVQQQPEFGAIMSFGNSDWPVLIAVDVMTSAKKVDVRGQFGSWATRTAATIEGAFGARKIWNLGDTHPYVGGGIALISAREKFEFESAGITFADADDTSIGPWVSGGVFWRLGNRFNLGFDVRYSTANVDLEFDGSFFVSDEKKKAGGFHAGLTLGFGW